MPEPAISNALNDDMVDCLATEDRGQQSPEFGVEESERRLVTHRVFGERGLLDLRVDGVAVERGREWRTEFEVRVGGGAAGRGADVAGLRGGQANARGLVARGASHGLAEV